MIMMLACKHLRPNILNLYNKHSYTEHSSQAFHANKGKIREDETFFSMLQCSIFIGNVMFLSLFPGSV